MAKFNTAQSFADGDSVTGAKLNNITSQLNIYTGVISEQTAMAATVSTADQLLIADTDNGDSGAANRVTVQKLLNDTLTNGTYTNAQLSGNLNVAQLSTLGTISSTRGTVGILNSTTGTIAGLSSTNGTVQTLTASTANITTGTIATLNSTTGTIATLNSTTGTITTGVIPTLTSITKITSGTGTAAAPAISPTGDTNTGIFFPAADTIAATTNGTEHLRITSTGNVGIGTTSPVQALSVVGATGTTFVSSITSQVATGAYMGFLDTTTTDRPLLGAVGNNFAILTATTERLRIDSSGNVSIGTATALSKLHVHGDLTMSNATTATTASTSTITPPATVAGYLTVSINGTSRKIAFYAT